MILWIIESNGSIRPGGNSRTHPVRWVRIHDQRDYLPAGTGTSYRPAREAAQRARSSNIEIADKAAYETAGQLSQVISQNNTRITDSINQLRQAMGGKEENPLAQLMNMMQSMQQFMGMFGIAMPGQIPGGGPQAEQWQPPPITRHKRNESQGGENV